MKMWHVLTIGISFGIALSGLIILIASPPRGKPISLLPSSTPKPIVVHIDGAVKQPGVYFLPSDSRLIHLVQSAGGLSDTADLETFNLAAFLKDGQKIQVPTINPAKPTNSSNLINSQNLPDNNLAININLASINELMTLPGIGESKAQAIIEYRNKNGLFQNISDLQKVPGIGSAIFEKIKAYIFLD